MIVISQLQLRRGQQLLLDNTSATINPGQKVGLVGKNGCGKSTLFALIKQQIGVDAGEISVPKQWAMAWVNQETPALAISALDYVLQGDREYQQLQQQLAHANQINDGQMLATVYGQLEAIDGWSIQARAASLLHGLGFNSQQHQLAVNTFSGGWRMRLNLAQALICRSDLLLLDEPTNHLDLDAIIWLEQWLKSYQGTLLLISHDRDFLDPIVNKILHIDQQSIAEYSGNYSDFERQRVAKLAQQQALYQQQQRRKAHLESYIDRFRAKASKAKQAQSRIKMLEKMEIISQAHIDNPFRFTFPPAERLPSPLLTMENVSIGYGEQTIIQQLKLNLVPGSRIGLLGQNGAGKSTLIKLLAGEITPLAGQLTLSKGVQLGYFAQHQLEYLQAQSSPLQHLQRLAPQATEQALRDYLGGFAFRGDKVVEAVDKFSGGEKARLVLALLIWQRPNLLLLDEPTNHLDLEMRQALTEALLDFSGALVVVSHDRHLLRATTDELYLVDQGKVAPFAGDLVDYQHWLAEQNKLKQTPPSRMATSSALPTTAKRQHKQTLQKQCQQLEKQLQQATLTLTTIEQQLADNSLYQAADHHKINQLVQQQTQLKQQIEEIETQWLIQHEALEQLNHDGA